MKNMFWNAYVNAMFMQPPKALIRYANRRGDEPVTIPTMRTLFVMWTIAMAVMGLALLVLGLL